MKRWSNVSCRRLEGFIRALNDTFEVDEGKLVCHEHFKVRGFNKTGLERVDRRRRIRQPEDVLAAQHVGTGGQ